MTRWRRKNTRNERPRSEVCMRDGIQNAAQTLLANIRFSSVDSPVRVVAVTSSVPNEGKTTVALALAVAVGKDGQTCLLVEGDMRRRSLGTLLGVRPRFGIHALLTGSCSLADAIAPTDYEGVQFLDAEQGIQNSNSIFASERFGELKDTLLEHYDYVIIDTPPVSAFVDAAVAASKSDGALLVVRQGFTNKADVVRAGEQLRAANANVVGLVMNGQGQGGGDYYYDYYYEYYSDDAGTEAKAFAEAGSRKGSKAKHVRPTDR